jgi:hypothetical protein
MMAPGDAGPSTILSSAYNQPSIVEAYLQSTLKDPSFPSIAIESLQELMTGSEEEADDYDLEAKSSSVQDAFESIEASLSIGQKAALKEAIKALGLFFATTQGIVDQKSIKGVVVEERLKLGYCKILDRQWIEAVVDLDIVRKQMYSSSKSTSKTQGRNENEAMKKAYVSALKGLQLACLLSGKKSDAVKCRRWIRQVEEQTNMSNEAERKE